MKNFYNWPTNSSIREKTRRKEQNRPIDLKNSLVLKIMVSFGSAVFAHFRMRWPVSIFLKITAVILLLSYSLTGFATSSEELMKEASQAYYNQDFSKAIQLYSELEKQPSADLYYNLGNTYYRMGQVGMAVYYYQKALRLNPRDRDLLANSRYVKSKRADQEIQPLSSKIYHTLFFWVDLLTLSELLVIALLFYTLFFGLLTFRLFKKKFVVNLALVLLFGINLVFFPTALIQVYTQYFQKSAVVISSTSAVFSEPTDQSIKLFELHEGSLFTVEENQGDYMKIVLSDGRRGWIKKDESKTL